METTKMVEVRKPDIFTTRPTCESEERARAYIKAELKTAGLDAEGVEISRGHDDPGGSTVYYVYLGDKNA